MKNSELRSFVLRLDLLLGCRLSCVGCKIKEIEESKIIDDDLKKLIELSTEMQSAGYRLTELVLGPTDVLTASNRTELLANRYFKRLAAMFHRMSITVNPLHYHNSIYDEWLSEFLGAKSEGSLFLEFPYDVKQARNITYNDRVRGRIRYVVDALKSLDIDGMAFVLPYDYRLEDHVRDTLEINGSLLDSVVGDKGFYIQYDINLHHGRVGFKNDAIKEDFIKCSKSVLELVKTSKSFDFDGIGFDEGKSLEVLYSAGDLYMVPFFFEVLPVIHPRFKIPDITATAVTETFDASYFEQVEISDRLTVCKDCPSLPYCATKNIITVMDAVGLEECLSVHNPERGLIK